MQPHLVLVVTNRFLLIRTLPGERCAKENFMKELRCPACNYTLQRTFAAFIHLTLDHLTFLVKFAWLTEKVSTRRRLSMDIVPKPV